MRYKVFLRLISSVIFSLMLIASVHAQTYQWAKKGISEGFDYGNGIVTDDSGNVYMGGQIEYTARFDGGVTLQSNGKHDISVGKFNAAGNIVWLKHAGGISGDVAWGVGIDQMHNVYITGEFEYTAGFGPGDSITVAGGNDAYLAKYDANGNVVWLRKLGGTGDDKARGIFVDKNGFSYVTGYFSGNATFGSFTLTSSGNNDVFVAKYTPDGNCMWVKKAGGSYEDRGRGIALDGLGNLFIAGTFTQSINFNGTNFTARGTNSAFIAKYDTSGNYLWTKTAGGCCDTTRYNAITCDNLGNAYVAGYFKDTAVVGTTTLLGKGVTDVLIAKYSSAGNVMWARNDGGLYEDMANHILYDQRSDALYIAGMFDYQGTFDTIQINSAGNRDAFFGMYTTAGRAKWIRSAGGTARDAGQAIACDTLGNILLTGFFNSAVTLGSTVLTGDSLADFFLTKSSPALEQQPVVSSSSISSSISSCSNVQLSWTSGSGSKRIIIARASQAVNSFPSDGVNYNANASYGSGSNLGNGNFVVYNGNGNTATVSGLAAGIQYYFSIVEYNGSYLTANYNTSSVATANYLVNGFAMTTSSSAPSVCPGGSATLTASGGISYTWTPSYGLSSTTGNSVVANPSVTTNYTVDGVGANGCHAVSQILFLINPLPVVVFDNHDAVCEHNPGWQLTGGIPFGGVYSGDAVRNGIFYADSSVNASSIINYTYTDANGCTSSDTSTFNIHPLPVITFNNQVQTCVNSYPLVLNIASPTGGNYSGIGITSNTFDPSVAMTGNNKVNYTYTDNNGCTNSDSSLIVLNNKPVVSVTSQQDACSNGAAFTLTGGIPAGGIFSGSGVGANNLFSPSTAGAGTINLNYFYTDANNCSDSISTTINVRTPPVVTFANLSPVCSGSQAFNLSGGIPAGGNYSGAVISGNMFNPATAGNYIISYSYRDSAGCSNNAQQLLTVRQSPVVTLASQPAVCQNAHPLTLSGGSPTGGMFSGMNVSAGIFSPSGLSPQLYPVTYSYTDSTSCTGRAVQNISVQTLPVIYLGGDTTLCRGNNIMLNAGSGLVNYHWSNGATTQTIQPANSSVGTFLFWVNAANASGCVSSDSISVRFDICSQVADIYENYPWFYAYPNPFKNSIKIFSEKKLQVNVYDISGRNVKTFEFEGETSTGDELSPGVYFLEAIYNGQRKISKIIKAN